MKRTTKVIIQKVIVTVLAVLFGFTSLATVIAMENSSLINATLGVQDYEVHYPDNASETDTAYYKSEYTKLSDLMTAGREMSELAEAEGIVLLENNGALPLNIASEEKKISLFGLASAKPVYGGTGSGSVDASTAADFKSGLEKAGFQVNTTLYDWYTANYDSYKGASTGLGGSAWRIGDAPWSDVNSANSSSFSQYGDAAIMIIGRVGGEGADLSRMNTEDGIDGDYLALNKNERSVLQGLKELKDKGTFQKIVVLLNSANPLEMAFLEEDYGIDAVVWIGSVGSQGANAVGCVLSGQVTPSGRLTDTYYNEHDDNPVVYNFGNLTFDGAKEMVGEGDAATYYSKYVVYQEGIYVGYRYVETRYEDVVLGSDKAGDFDYAATVRYPFGYGLSYTQFDYSDFGVSYDAASDMYQVSITVTNSGSVAGKEVVQVYCQQPYTDYDRTNGVEKAAVSLAGFAKTSLLNAGGSETMTISVPGSVFASYDANGLKTYFRDDGTHYLTVAKNAHDAVNNILVSKQAEGAVINQEALTGTAGDADMVYSLELARDEETYSVSQLTGTAISNLFDHADINKYEERGDNSVQYMTRSDWAGTVDLTGPVRLSLTEGMYKDMQYDIPQDSEEYPVYGSKDTAHQLIDLRAGADGNPIPFDDPKWEELLDQLTWEETVELCITGLRCTAAVPSIGKPETLDHNGPSGLTQAYRTGKNGLAYINNDPDRSSTPTCYPSNNIIASSFNLELASGIGQMIGEDALWAGYSGLYGTGANIHRSPYEGRYFEYFSEDAFLTGKMVAQESMGIQEHGCYVYNKHFVLNEQESNRAGVSTWCNEQAMRENYLRAFEIGIAEGSAKNVMTSFNRLGCIWSSADHNLCTKLLRDEWGMEGFAVTDMYNGSYMDRAAMLLAGNDLPDNNGKVSDFDAYRSGYGELAQCMRESAHRILYTVAHSNAMNGYIAGTYTVPVTPVWQIAIFAATSVFGVLLAASVAWVVLSFYKVRRNRTGGNADVNVKQEL